MKEEKGLPILRGKYTETLSTWDHPDHGTVLCGDLMTVDEYLESVSEGMFIDYDGYGHPVKDNMEDQNLQVFPSEGRRMIPLDATHIIWFNR